MIQPEYRDARPLYQQVKEGIRKMIISHAVREGEEMPSVRELSARLAVNPYAVTLAYRELEQEGYIRQSGREGCFTVAAVEEEKPCGEMFRTFDEAVKELVRMSVGTEELVQRVKRLAEGEKEFDRG